MVQWESALFRKFGEPLIIYDSEQNLSSYIQLLPSIIREDNKDHLQPKAVVNWKEDGF